MRIETVRLDLGDSPRDWLEHLLDRKAGPNGPRDVLTVVRAVPALPSGGWRATLARALDAIPTGAAWKAVRAALRRRLDAVDTVGAWDVRADYTCPHCARVRPAAAFGPRIARVVDVAPADAARLVAAALASCEPWPAQRERIGVVGDGAEEDTVRVALPVRQSRCGGCR